MEPLLILLGFLPLFGALYILGHTGLQLALHVSLKLAFGIAVTPLADLDSTWTVAVPRQSIQSAQTNVQTRRSLAAAHYLVLHVVIDSEAAL
jgi:hypothetical protein